VAAPESRAIVIPSRRRAGGIPQMLKCFPDAYVCVEDSEENDYKTVVPRDQLVLHPPLGGAAHVRNWMIDYFQEDCIFQVDDDFRRIQCYCNADVRDVSYITDASHIAGVIDNAHWPAFDLGIGVFSWARFANPMQYRPFEPMLLCGTPIMCSFGMRGPARTRKFDPAVPHMADLNFAMETYRDDRIAYVDARYYWDFGKIYSGVGGNQGLVTYDQKKNSIRLMRSRWTRYLTYGSAQETGGRGMKSATMKPDTQGISIRIPRKSIQAARGFPGRKIDETEKES
jgi:glycosyltransferase involved in cell wall biosynthesis